MEELENFLKDAIETDTPSEHTVPLNDNGEFVNGVFYEDKVHEAQVKVTVLDHYTDDEEKEKVTDWVIELRCDEHEVITKEVKLDEEATLLYKPEQLVLEEGVDPVELFGTQLFELSILPLVSGVGFGAIKVRVS